MKRLILAAMCLALVLPAGPALAYTGRGFDPDDRRVIGFDPDIRSTVRRVWTTEGSRRALRVKFQAYERLGNFWSVKVFLDSRRGPEADYVMELYNADMSGKGCSVFPRGHRERSDSGSFRQRRDTALCRVRARLVHPTDRIRWRLRSPSGYGHDNVDIAPNGGGWYQ